MKHAQHLDYRVDTEILINRRSDRARILAFGFAAFTGIVLLLSWHNAITGSKQELDSEANIRAALNMSRTGVFSDLVEAPSTPRMEREPLPAFTGSIAVRIVDAVLGPGQGLDDYVQGERVIWLKHQNLLWLALCSSAWHCSPCCSCCGGIRCIEVCCTRRS